MRIFLFHILKVLGYSFILGFILQFMADEGLRKMENSGFSEWDQILKGEINADLIIKGSSRGAVGYNPEVIERITGLESFNISFDAGSHNLQEIKSILYDKNNSTPEVIIQNIDLTHFSISKQIPNKYQFIPFYLSSNLRAQFRSVESDFMEYYYIPLLNYNGNNILLYKGIGNFLGFNLSNFKSRKGFYSVDKKFRADSSNLEHLAHLDKKSSLKNWAKGLTSLKRMVLENDNSVLILVWAPEYKDRLRAIEHILPDVKKRVESLTLLNKKVFFLDLSRHAISEDQSMFYDTFHLNKKGAETFSTLLALKINKILQEK